jgi:release factor glutamine methyltransferase
MGEDIPMKYGSAITIQKAVVSASQFLDPVSKTARQDATVLLAHILGKTRSWVVAHPESVLSSRESGVLEQALKKLEERVPLPYIIGHWEFHGMDFLIDGSVLIPRPETELMVDHAMEWLACHPQQRLAADIGTGSGCIAISLAARIPDLTVYACDLSSEAIEVANRNVRQHDLEGRVHICRADLFEGLPSPVDLICANLPYIPSADTLRLEVSRHEPMMALDGGEDGLQQIRRLLLSARPWINPQGLILIEIEARQGASAYALTVNQFQGASIQVTRDLAGFDRLLSIDLGSNIN